MIDFGCLYPLPFCFAEVTENMPADKPVAQCPPIVPVAALGCAAAALVTLPPMFRARPSFHALSATGLETGANGAVGITLRPDRGMADCRARRATPATSCCACPYPPRFALPERRQS